MEKLFEHTLQRQVAEQSKEIGELKGQIAELTALMKGGTLSTTTNNNNNNNSTNNTNNGTQLIQNNNSQTTININPWGGALWIPIEALEDLFAESEMLQRYARIGPDKMDAEETAGCVQELFVSLLKKVHEDPRERNVYLNPKRSDQVLVFDRETWTLLTLAEAVRSIFDRISRRLTQMTSPTAGSEWRKMAPEVRDPVASLNIEYIQNSEGCVAGTKGSTTAHMENMTPGRQRLALPAPPAKNGARQQQRKEAEEEPEEARPQQRQKEAEEPKARTTLLFEAKMTEPLRRPVAVKKASAPPPFTIDDAAALLRLTKRERGESHASYAKRLFEGARAQDPSRIMTKLWEAQEERLLSETEAVYVRELVSKHDEGVLA